MLIDINVSFHNVRASMIVRSNRRVAMFTNVNVSFDKV